MHSALPLHGEVPAPATRPRWALAAKGFRPFFLLAAAFAALIVPLWLLALLGVLDPGGYLGPTYWHAHEMVFGFAVAVIAGFLLTAVGNWTGRETIVGVPLLALAGLWLAGRVAIAAARAFPDHHPYHPRELRGLAKLASRCGAPLVTTEKDVVRIPPEAGVDVLALRIAAVVHDEAPLLALVRGALAKRGA